MTWHPASLFGSRTARLSLGASFSLLLGCAQSTYSGATWTSGSVASAGAAHEAPIRSNPVVASHTLSVALDRIDQRNLPLDRTYRRTASGRGVTVYVFDGGISTTHPELTGRVRVGYSAFPSDPKICNAHGTAVAGAIAGTTLGVAPEAEIVDVKMVECTRLRGTIRAIVEGAHWVIEDHRRRGGGPAIANWSFIADTASRIAALDSAVAALRRAGISVVVSAGNVEMDACRISPGNSPGTVVVGASALQGNPEIEAPRDRRAPGTAFGPCIDVYAPGDSVLLPSLERGGKPSTQLWNGTSMAAGYVSGAAALFLETNPLATPDDVMRHLRGSGTRDVVLDSRSRLSSLLFVGPRGQAEQPLPAEVALR